MKPLRISAVSYLNTFPFVYGIQQSGFLQDYQLDLDVPSRCAEKLKDGQADLALVPAGALADFRDYHIVSDYCIGAIDKVLTVLLLSHKPLEKIRHIGLDFDSRTSVRLVQVLAGSFWKINPSFVRLKPGEATSARDLEAIVAIGDKTFDISSHYPYKYDLAEEWIRYTGLPFVFALWISTRSLPGETKTAFSNALKFGVEHIDATLEYFSSRLPANADCHAYLTRNISYTLDKEKKEGLNLFLSYL